MVSTVGPFPNTPVLGMVPTNGTIWYIQTVVFGANQTQGQFMLFAPDSPAGQARPMLTCFHGARTSQFDILVNTSFLLEAGQRDWFLLAPYQAPFVDPTLDDGLSYASVASQEHVEAAVSFVLENPSFTVDLDRIYAVGFSMGGGNALSYAARHRDRERGAFAAVVNHTGTVALSHVYESEPLVRAQMELLFGGTPTQAPFAYQRSSLVELDAAGALVQGGRHMASNLLDVPIRTYYGQSDQVGYLVQQSVELDAYMQAQPGSDHELIVVPSNCTPQQAGHCWGTLDEREACDWLGTKALDSSSTDGRFLVDRNARWGPFEVEPALVNQFSGFRFNVDSPSNVILIRETENTLRVGFDPEERGLDPNAPLEVHTGSVDGTGDRIVLDGYPSEPTTVLRNGVQILQPFCGTFPGASTWCFDDTTGTLELNEIGSAPAVWTIVR